MTLYEVLNRLESSGSEETKKKYIKQGAGDNIFGVAISDIENLAEKIISAIQDSNSEHNMAIELWNTGNVDARILAAMIIKPEKLSESLIEKWINEIDFYLIADYFAQKIYQYHFCMEKLMEWTLCDAEYIKRTGFIILTLLSKNNKEAIDTIFAPYLKQIEHEIHYSDRFAREAMYSALIAIGSRNENLNTLAREAAAKIGVIQIDDGINSAKSIDTTDELSKITFN